MQKNKEQPEVRQPFLNFLLSINLSLPFFLPPAFLQSLIEQV